MSALPQLAELLTLLRAVLVRDFGLTPDECHVLYKEKPGRIYRLPFPVPNHQVPAENLNDMERDILQAVAELGGAPTGEQIAERSGYPFNSGLRVILASMRRRKLLGGKPGTEGYAAVTD